MAGSSDVAHKQNGDNESAPVIGCDFEVSSMSVVKPGKEILFSVPKEFLLRDRHLEIPFDFELPERAGPRPVNVGGSPRMLVLYSIQDLPVDMHLLNH